MKNMKVENAFNFGSFGFSVGTLVMVVCLFNGVLIRDGHPFWFGIAVIPIYGVLAGLQLGRALLYQRHPELYK